MAVRTETLHVTGIRCERCVHRLAAALQGHDGLEYANAKRAERGLPALVVAADGTVGEAAGA